jgi:hypothetical protein
VRYERCPWRSGRGVLREEREEGGLDVEADAVLLKKLPAQGDESLFTQAGVQLVDIEIDELASTQRPQENGAREECRLFAAANVVQGDGWVEAGAIVREDEAVICLSVPNGPPGRSACHASRARER